MDIAQALKRPFDPKKISWRVGSTNSEKTKGIALAYIDARDVMHRLDEVFGLNWQNRYTHAEGKTICEIGCKIDGEWIWRAGGAGDTDIEAEKGAISDAFKRAAVLWGIGQYLYGLPNEWVDLVASGRSYKLAKTPSLPKWATPEGFDVIMASRAAAERLGIPQASHKPSDNSAYNPEGEELEFITNIRDTLLSFGEDYQVANEYLIEQRLDADQSAWINNCMDSKFRAAIKKLNSKEQ